MSVMLCPEACGGTLVFGGSGAECTACRHVFAYRGRVLDLVGGECETKLDVAAWTAPASGLFLEEVRYPEQ